MAALAGLIGGAGSAAAEHGKQVRSILESRRQQYIGLLGELIKNETDPQRLSGYHSTLSDLLGNKPIEKIAPTAFKMLQDNHQADTTLSQSLGGPPGTPKPKPGPAQPGQTPGTLQPGGAAQPGSSPVQPQSQQIQPVGQSPEQDMEHPNPIADMIAPPQQVAPQAAVPPQQGAPQPASQTATGVPTEYLGHPISYWQGTPKGTEMVSKFLEPYITNAAALAQHNAQAEADLGRKRTGLTNLKANTDVWNGLPQNMRANFEAEAGGLAPVQMPQAFYTPRLISTATDGADAPPGTMEYGTTTPVTKGKPYRVERIGDGTTIWQPELGPAPIQTQDNAGNMQLNNRFSGNLIGPVQGAVAPSQNTPHIVFDAQGHPHADTAAQVNANSPNLLSPQFAPVTHEGTTYNPATGETHENKTTTRRGGGGGPTPPGGPIPPPSNIPTHGPGGNILGTADFQKRVKSAVDTMMIPNQSTSQLAAAEKLLGPPGAPFRNAVNTEFWNRKNADSGPLAWDISTAERAQLSKQTLVHLDTIDKLIGKLDSAHELGPVMSRWNEFWTGHIGTDLTKNSDYVELKNNIDLLTKVMGRIHGGARGGGSIQMIQSFANKLNTDKMDADTLRGAIRAEKDWLSSYADPAAVMKPAGGGGASIPTIKTGDKAAYDALPSKSQYIENGTTFTKK